MEVSFHIGNEGKGNLIDQLNSESRLAYRCLPLNPKIPSDFLGYTDFQIKRAD